MFACETDRSVSNNQGTGGETDAFLLFTNEMAALLYAENEQKLFDGNQNNSITLQTINPKTLQF